MHLLRLQRAERARQKERNETAAQYFVILSIACQCSLFLPIDAVVLLRSTTLRDSLLLLDIYNLAYTTLIFVSPINIIGYLALCTICELKLSKYSPPENKLLL